MTSLREGADRVAARLRDAGYEAYFAGGCVRDALLGVTPKDYDVVTDATPEQVCVLFKRTLKIGAAFGVVKVLLGRGLEYEVATYREDGNYSDGRRPDEVVYSSSKVEDVKRRDFTVNGLLMDPRTDEILDYVGGRDDLAARRIRAVGDPALRFAEDRLRMLRAVRFAVRFGFEIEGETMAAIQAHAGGITDVSAERITTELLGVFRSPRPRDGVRLLVETGLMPGVLPFVKNADALAERFERYASVRDEIDDPAGLAWALTVDEVAARDVDDALRGLKLSRDVIRVATRLVRVRDVLDTEVSAPRYLREVLADDAALVAAYLGVRDGESERWTRFVHAREAAAADPFPERPILSGKDLQSLGLKPGRHFKTLLDAVDDAVLERRVTTRDEALALVRGLTGDAVKTS